MVVLYTGTLSTREASIRANGLLMNSPSIKTNEIESEFYNPRNFLFFATDPMTAWEIALSRQQRVFDNEKGGEARVIKVKVPKKFLQPDLDFGSVSGVKIPQNIQKENILAFIPTHTQILEELGRAYRVDVKASA